MNDRKPDEKQWENAITINVGSISILVTKLAVTRPKFSIDIGTVADDGKTFRRHIPVFTEGQGKVEIDTKRTGALGEDFMKAIEKVLLYIVEDAQKAEDAFQHKRSWKESHRPRAPESDDQKKGKKYSGPRVYEDRRK